MAHSVYPWRVRRCSERQFEADEKRSNYFPCSFRPSILLQVRYLLNQFEHLDFQTRGMINLSLGGNRGYVALRKRRPLAQGCRNVFNRLKVKEDNTKAIRTSRRIQVVRRCVPNIFVQSFTGGLYDEKDKQDSRIGRAARPSI